MTSSKTSAKRSVLALRGLLGFGLGAAVGQWKFMDAVGPCGGLELTDPVTNAAFAATGLIGAIFLMWDEPSANRRLIAHIGLAAGSWLMWWGQYYAAQFPSDSVAGGVLYVVLAGLFYAAFGTICAAVIRPKSVLAAAAVFGIPGAIIATAICVIWAKVPTIDGVLVGASLLCVPVIIGGGLFGALGGSFEKVASRREPDMQGGPT